MTLGLPADRDSFRRRPDPGEPTAGDNDAELIELLEDMAVLMVPSAAGEMEYAKPRRNGGGSYVTPKSG
jgi:hypothetical protein